MNKAKKSFIKKHLPHSPVEIVQEGAAVLRQKAELVPIAEITSPKIKKIIHEMEIALASQNDGVGLAAPQIGHALSIFIISKDALQKIEEAKIESATAENPEAEVSRKTMQAERKVKKTEELKNLVFINPRMIKLSKEKDWLDEGCLSVRWLYGKVRRSLRAKIGAYDEHGKYFERGAGGTLAHIFQHEMDHLEGVLFIDKAVDLEEMEPNFDEEPSENAGNDDSGKKDKNKPKQNES